MATVAVRLAAVSAGLGLGSYRVYAAAEETERLQLVRPQQLSVYSPPAASSTYIEEQPGRLQEGFSVVRQTVHPYIEWCKGLCDSVKNGVLNTVQFGQDGYSFLKDPPAGFLPRVGVITVSGLAGLVLARKGSRFKKVVYPLGLTALGISLCYPTQAVVVAKVTGQKVYAASHWTYGAIGSLWKENGMKKTKPTATPELNKPVSDSEVPSQEAAEKQNGPVIKEALEVVLHEMEPAAVKKGTWTQQEHEQPATTETAAIAEPAYSQSVNTDANSVSESTLTSDANKKKFVADPSLMDHGQSSPEDVDMYSTRS